MSLFDGKLSVKYKTFAPSLVKVTFSDLAQMYLSYSLHNNEWVRTFHVMFFS